MEHEIRMEQRMRRFERDSRPVLRSADGIDAGSAP
jgi:hypothetical protein